MTCKAPSACSALRLLTVSLGLVLFLGPCSPGPSRSRGAAPQHPSTLVQQSILWLLKLQQVALHPHMFVRSVPVEIKQLRQSI